MEAELKGGSFEKRMLTTGYEWITLKSIYRREDIVNLPHLNSFPGFAPFASAKAEKDSKSLLTVSLCRELTSQESSIQLPTRS